MVIIRFDHLNQRLGQVLFPVDDDIRLFTRSTDSSRHPRRRADTVQVAEFMPHDQNLVRIFNQLRQRICNHTGFDLGPLFNTFGNAAVKFIQRASLDRRLVAAAPQRHIQCLTCRSFAFSKRLFSPTDTDGQGDRQAARLNFSDIIQNRKTTLYDLFQMLFLNHHQELFAVVPFDK